MVTFENLKSLIDHLAQPVTTDDAYAAGVDCAKVGPNPVNCSYRFFSRRDLTVAWEQGKAAAEAAPAKP